MTDSKRRIMARRSAFIAAAALTASCDRCDRMHPSACLSVSLLDDEGGTSPPPRPLVCLSAPPRPCLEMVPDPDAAAMPVPDASSPDGGAIKLQTIDVNVADAGTARPIPCLSRPAPTPSPTPKVCLTRME